MTSRTRRSILCTPDLVADRRQLTVNELDKLDKPDDLDKSIVMRQRILDELIRRQRRLHELGMSPEATQFLITMFYIGYDNRVMAGEAMQAAEEATGIDQRRVMPEIDASISLWGLDASRPETAPAPDEIGSDGVLRCDRCHRTFYEVPPAPMFRDNVWLRLWDATTPEA